MKETKQQPEPTVVQPQPKQPLRIGSIVRYVSKTPYGNADLPAVVMSQHPGYTGLRVFTDSSGGSEWPVSTSESAVPTPGFFYRQEEQ
jgi:hypothetical protein